MDVLIRPCQASDLEHLESVLPSGHAHVHQERYSAQERGESTYLITWLDGRAVAHVMIRWTGSMHDHVRHQFPDVPEIGRLQVSESLRGQGIGSRLLAQAEQLIGERGHAIVGLAVGVRNSGALRLYDRVGYVDWGQGIFPSHWLAATPDGELEARPHDVTYLFKPLTASAGADIACA